jgi:FAD/FMN-containing dehydrogenase
MRAPWPPSRRLTRREFVAGLTRAAGAGAIVGFDPLRRTWVTASDGQVAGLDALPALDGVVVADRATLDAAADDRGHIVHHLPRAVLRPKSVRDIVRIVRYANHQRLKVAMRGQGHSHYGHAQVDAGIVIDSSTLRLVESPSERTIDAQPGATWADVTDASLMAGLTPPVLPDVMMLTVGGTLSVGGLGCTSQHHGSIADNVEELDVVTGDGRLITCSNDRERELFDMVLAGIGQCAIIVRARLRVVPAPETVTLWELPYSNLTAYIADHDRIARRGLLQHQYGWMERRERGRWRGVIQAGLFDAPASAAFPAHGLQFSSIGVRRTTRYRDYLHRLTAFVEEASQRPDWSYPRPSVTLFLPRSEAYRFLATVLRTPADTEGIWRFDVCPFLTSRFKRPLLRMPNSAVAFSFWMFRTAPGHDRTALDRMLRTVRSLLDRARVAGGTPYAPYFNGDSDAWRAALGPTAWNRLSEAKRTYDPKHVLTPGAHLFA